MNAPYGNVEALDGLAPGAYGESPWIPGMRHFDETIMGILQCALILLQRSRGQQGFDEMRHLVIVAVWLVGTARRPLSQTGPSMTADIKANLKTFLDDRAPEARYASFDYCFDHFLSAREAGQTDQLADNDSLLVSCLQLGFYLASWGMMRGSGDLLQRSVRDLAPVVRAIAAEPADVWNLGAGDLITNADAVLGLASRIR